ncbi:MAG TPA: hypothetical protein VGR00_13690, partial [Thermoanaerobaculia bacterium]|nr:hypothetical protein [Thermoanaerobaculia bacterium]
PSNPNAHQILAAIEVSRADAAKRAARDARPFFDAAEAALKKAQAIDAADVDVLTSFLKLHGARARWLRETGRDPAPEARAAEAAHARAAKINPEYAGTDLELANTLLQKARFDVEKGHAPTGASRVEALLTRGLALTPDASDAYRLMGELHLLRARDARRNREEMTKPLADAETAIKRAIEMNGLDTEAPLLLAELERMRGRIIAAPAPAN